MTTSSASGSESEEAAGLRRARLWTIAIGAVGTSVALALSLFEIRSLFDRFLEFVGLFGGTLGGLFGLGVLTRRATSSGALFGAALSLGLLFYARAFTELSPLLYSSIAMISCFVGGFVFSLLTRSDHE